MNRELYLGTCIFKPQPFTRVEALALAEAGAWRIYDFTQNLPKEGRAFAPSLPGYDMGNYLSFRVVPNERNNGDKDQFLVVDPMRVAQVLDFRDRDPELARRALVEEGIPSLLPGSDSVVVALPDRLCTVVPMIKHPSERLFIASNEHLHHLPSFVLDERLFEGNDVGGRWIAVPDVTVGVQVSSLNWCPDADFLEWLLKRLRKAGNGLPITRSQIPNVVGYLSRACLLPTGGEDLTPSIGRFKRLAKELAANQAAVAEMVDVLSAFESVDSALDSKRAEARRELKQELEPIVRADLENTLGDLAVLREKFCSEIAILEHDVADAESRADAAEAAHKALEAGLMDELAAVSEALETEGGSTHEVEDLARRLGERLAASGRGIELLPGPVPPWSRLPGMAAGNPADWIDAGTLLDAAAGRAGYSPEELRLADLAARAGLVLLLPQGGALDFVRCYALVVAGGPPVVEALHPAVISLNDLWRPPRIGRTNRLRSCLDGGPSGPSPIPSGSVGRPTAYPERSLGVQPRRGAHRAGASHQFTGLCEPGSGLR